MKRRFTRIRKCVVHIGAVRDQKIDDFPMTEERSVAELAVEIDAAEIATGIQYGLQRRRVVVINEPLHCLIIALMENVFPILQLQEVEHEIGPPAGDSIEDF